MRDLVEVKYRDELGALEHSLGHYTTVKRHNQLVARASEIEESAARLAREGQVIEDSTKALDRKLEELKASGAAQGKSRAKFGAGKGDASPRSSKKGAAGRKGAGQRASKGGLDDSASKLSQSSGNLAKIDEEGRDKGRAAAIKILERPATEEKKREELKIEEAKQEAEIKQK